MVVATGAISLRLAGSRGGCQRLARLSVQGPMRGLRSRGASGRILRARARLPEQAEGVVAGMVPVCPQRRDGVLADQLEVREGRLGLGQDRSRVEPAGLARLASAEGAGAHPAQPLEVIP